MIVSFVEYCWQFQLTPSRRATRCFSSFQHFSSISTHALTEGDTVVRFGFLRFRISPHALTEGDSYFILFNTSFQHFNSRPHGGRRIAGVYGMFSVRNFNSRPHGGRQCKPRSIRHRKAISTHALTEGDRLQPAAFFVVTYISTHALTEGDFVISKAIPEAGHISTHALTEGDRFEDLQSHHAGNFNSRPHGGRP